VVTRLAEISSVLKFSDNFRFLEEIVGTVGGGVPAFKLASEGNREDLQTGGGDKVKLGVGTWNGSEVDLPLAIDSIS